MPRRPLATAADLSLLLALALAGGACDGPGNSGIYMPDPDLVRMLPWLNGVTPAIENDGAGTVSAVMPPLPVYPPIGLGLPDPGSQHIDCSGLVGLELSRGWIDSFEPLGPGEAGVAPGWASYDDLTKFAFHTPGDYTWYPGLATGALKPSTAWGMPAEQVPGPSCDGQPNQWALHYRGGLFRKWGGGISHGFTDPDGWYRDKDRTAACMRDGMPVDFCPPPLAAGATVDTAGFPTTPPAGGVYDQAHDFFDVDGKYEGVAFWARRGPEGHDRVVVILNDKHTSSHLNRENQLYCRRVRECHTRCLSGAPCSPDDPASANPIHRCWDPTDPKFATALGPRLPAIAVEAQMDLMFPRCGPSACSSQVTYKDDDFDGKQCRPYAYPASEESGEYCWNPGDPPPPDRDERCDDAWKFSVELTPNWKFHAIPFTQFAQAGFGKRAEFMDLKSLDVIAFAAPVGYADFYIDNVTFYRRQK